ncbi:MAG: SAM-dependent DNA methyltransferase [Planctomycetota bacterium]
MSALQPTLRRQLENTVKQARRLAETGALAALERLSVGEAKPHKQLEPAERDLRNRLRAKGRQLGDKLDDKDGVQGIVHLKEACAYEYWHRMLFARFLAENGLLIHSGEGVGVTLDDVEELAQAEGTDRWTLAGRYASAMLPEIFRPDDPLLQLEFAPEHKQALEKLLAALPNDVFVAGDSLGWVYQFWQADRKDEVNAAGNKIGADELSAVTQLFTEDYMVDFLLDNTLGAWWAGKRLAANPKLATSAKSEDELRKAVALPGVEWKYLRFVKDDSGAWRPAAGTFDGWPKTARGLTCIDPCMGSGHFVVAMFERLVALRVAEEGISEKAAVQAVLRENLFGLELDPRCTQIAAFNLALAAWRRVGYCALPPLNLACSGLAPNATQEDWLSLAQRAKAKHQRHVPADLIHNGLVNLYGLFKDAPTLGSLINPKALGSVVSADYDTLLPFLAEAFAVESGDVETHERAVAAQGMVKAAEILAGEYTLVATNVPYLGRGKQHGVLTDYCERVYPLSKTDLATCFVERCITLCHKHGTTTLVSPQNWLFLSAYAEMRTHLLQSIVWNVVARLGEGGFDSPQAAGAFVALTAVSKTAPQIGDKFSGLEVATVKELQAKANYLENGEVVVLSQSEQLKNPDSTVVIGLDFKGIPLKECAGCWQGVITGDDNKFVFRFWEFAQVHSAWSWLQGPPQRTRLFDGKEWVIRWENRNGDLHKNSSAHNFPSPNMLGRPGIAFQRMRNLNATLFSGDIFGDHVAPIVPHDPALVAALWCFCNSEEYRKRVRDFDATLKVAVGSFLKVPFDFAHWQKVAAEKYPDGLPKPHSDDPTQWLFNGHPAGSDNPLHVAVARLLGYRWPRQTGSSFPDCPTLGPDGLEKFEDDDGIVCLSSVRGEAPAADRLRELLAAAYGKAWKPAVLDELLSSAGSSSLDDWLRNGFFEQHFKLFHHRPFIWHIWDGRKDGFNVLVNYHRLDFKRLEKLAYTYLGDWIKRQEDALKQGASGADDRLLKARELQKKLELILTGDAPHDIFVRWKKLEAQPAGWHTDLNDGVRLNIRPFMTADVLRKRPNIKWGVDRGKNPPGAPWGEERDNDRHLGLKEKADARQKRT